MDIVGKVVQKATELNHHGGYHIMKEKRLLAKQILLHQGLHLQIQLQQKQAGLLLPLNHVWLEKCLNVSHS